MPVRFARPEGAVIVASAMSVIGTGPLLNQPAVLPVPPTPPLRSRIGGNVTVATATLLDSEPSDACRLIVKLSTSGPPAVLVYLMVRSTAW